MSERFEQSEAGRREPESRGYNGWRNYPTWAVFTWLSNDEDTYRRASAVAHAAGGPYRAADDLRSEIVDGNPLAEDTSLYADALGWALQVVDWEAVARAFGPEEWEDDETSAGDGN